MSLPGPVSTPSAPLPSSPLPVDSVALGPRCPPPADTSADLVTPAAACRNATAGQSGLSSTLARCQNCPPLLCKCAWLWPVSWRGGGRMPPLPGARVLPLGGGEQSAVPPTPTPPPTPGCCMLTSVYLVSSLHSWGGRGSWHGKGGRGAWLLPGCVVFPKCLTSRGPGVGNAQLFLGVSELEFIGGLLQPGWGPSRQLTSLTFPCPVCVHSLSSHHHHLPDEVGTS